LAVLSRLRRALRPQPIPDRLWRAALARTAYARELPRARQAELRELATRLLRKKALETAHGLVLTDAMRTLIAARAAIPVLGLGFDYYNDWVSIIVYPGDFRVRHTYTDDIGVEHHYVDELCGESLSNGPMVLSWETIASQDGSDGTDLVIHECAHKLDILNGDANGFPPLHQSMSRNAWTSAFREAYDRFATAVDAGEQTKLDPYGATDAAEFFAVLSEAFFTQPRWVADPFPDVYHQLRAFYRQDPLAPTAGRGHK
jgi:Mlc titration factor MtfA (ptsG expression regulator)